MDHLKSVEELAFSLTDELKAIAARWATATAALRALPHDELTSLDQRKLDQCEVEIRGHLERYGFRSFQPGEISLSRDNFRPLVFKEQNGQLYEKEINFEISASDAIRLKWAYYLACLELSKVFKTNHPKVVIFDEPGQQEIDSASLSEFLRSASRSSVQSHQVIVSTSETLAAVRDTLGSSANIVSFPCFILQPL